MDNPETLATLGTQDRGRRQTKQKHNTQNLKIDEQHGFPPKIGGEPMCTRRVAVRVSYTTLAMLLI